MKYKKITLIILPVFFLGFVLFSGDIYYQISKSIEIFGEVYKQTTLNYVDEIDPEKFVTAGIKGMLKSLDPYTRFYDSEQKRDVDVFTRGKYGGIGVSIGLRDGKVTIMELFDGYSAQRQGLRIGDVIFSIDSVKIGKDNYDLLSTFLKGEPGTTVHLRILREGVSDTLNFDLVREEVELMNLIYSDLIGANKNIAYLKLVGFSRTAGDEILNTLKNLNEKTELEGIILDLRGNPGGLLDAAIDVSEKFLPNKSLIVSVVGRDSINTKRYFSKEEPIAGKTKLVVLINGYSASASEIVAGAIQDHDRGVILGEQSFGKGLVQTIIPLPYDNTMKITTARYYTPSGRCIQKLDYSEKVLHKPKHIKKKIFRTDSGRIVYSAGGITPDTVIVSLEFPQIIEQLLARGMFFKFGAYYFNTNETNDSLENKLLNDNKIFNAFSKYLENENFNFTSSEKKILDELINSEIVTKNEELLKETENISNLIKKIEKDELRDNKELIVKLIRLELAAQSGGRKGRIKESLREDKQLISAIDIIANDSLYREILR